jgi:Sulfotransferase domain
MSLPELYLVGAPKAGTTSIAAWLAGHPSVFWSTPKEPFFWAADYPRMRSHYGFATRVEYERLYASPEAESAPVRGDGSTTYLYSQVAVPDILAAVPSARFVVCLRSPADLVVSYHRTQLVALNDDEPDFRLAWRRSLAGRPPDTDPLDPKLVDYPTIGRLGSAVERLIDAAGRDRVHAVVFEDLVADPAAVWEQLAAFVGVDARHQPAFEALNASTKTFRSPALRRLLHRPPHGLQGPVAKLRQWSRTTRAPGVSILKRQAWTSAPRPEGALDRQEVGDFFADDVALLARVIGRDLSSWAGVADPASP